MSLALHLTEEFSAQPSVIPLSMRVPA